MWVDGLFMGQMFLVRYGAYVDGSDRDFCFREAIRQLNLVFDRCEKDGSGLLYHAYSARPGTPWANVVTCLLYTSKASRRRCASGGSCPRPAFCALR